MSDPFDKLILRVQTVLQDKQELIWHENQLRIFLNDAQKVVNEKLKVVRRKFYITPDRKYPDNYQESLYAANENYDTILVGRKQDALDKYGDSFDYINQSATVICDNFSDIDSYELAPNPTQKEEETSYLDSDEWGVIAFINCNDDNDEPVMKLDTVENNFITRIINTNTIPFQSEFGVINYCNGCQFNSDYGMEQSYRVVEDRGFVLYSCDPEDNVVEINDTVVLVYYALSKAYLADTEIQDLDKSTLYMNLFNSRIGRLTGGESKSKHRNRLGKYF